MIICRDCHKTIKKSKEEITPLMEINTLCKDCSEKLLQWWREHRPDLLDCENFGLCIKTQCPHYPNCERYKKSVKEYRRDLYLTTHHLYSKMIQFGLTTEEELNENHPNWREIEEKETNYMYKEKYKQMRKHWPEDKIQKYKKADLEYEIYLGLR